MLHVFDFDFVDFSILTHLPYVYQSYFDVWYFSTTPPTRKFFKLTICLSIQSLKTRILTACVSNMTFKKFETVLFMKILFNLQGAFNRFELLNCKNKKNTNLFLTQAINQTPVMFCFFLNFFLTEKQINVILIY